MTRLSDFFHGSDNRIGTFYPNHYLVAVFRNLELARNTVTKLQQAGFGPDQAIAASGEEVIALTDQETNLASYLIQALSRFLATEQVFADHDLKHAQNGAGFVAVHCPTEERKKAAWDVIAPEDPFDARYYGSGGIEHLAGDVDTD